MDGRRKAEVARRHRRGSRELPGNSSKALQGREHRQARPQGGRRLAGLSRVARATRWSCSLWWIRMAAEPHFDLAGVPRIATPTDFEHFHLVAGNLHERVGEVVDFIRLPDLTDGISPHSQHVEPVLVQSKVDVVTGPIPLVDVRPTGPEAESGWVGCWIERVPVAQQLFTMCKPLCPLLAGGFELAR